MKTIMKGQWIRGVMMMLLLAGTVRADGRGFGIGIILGEPTGVSFKKWVSDSNAYAAALGWSFIGDTAAINMHIDYLWHDHKILQGKENALSEISFFYGLGGRFKMAGQTQVGLRIPLGINYQAVKSPLEVFLEIVPILNLTPSTTFNVNGGLGVRSYFQ